MQACFARPITLAELAGSVNLSPYHFQRSFKARFHVTPQQMLMAIRLQRAKGWLAAGLPAAEVAASCGLADQSHLNRAFMRPGRPSNTWAIRNSRIRSCMSRERTARHRPRA
jgi:transcriptional regulator GlxA family with amidase domain